MQRTVMRMIVTTIAVEQVSGGVLISVEQVSVALIIRILRFGNWKRERKWKSEMVKIWIQILAGLDIQPV
jgi:hypothetical protein